MLTKLLLTWRGSTYAFVRLDLATDRHALVLAFNIALGALAVGLGEEVACLTSADADRADREISMAALTVLFAADARHALAECITAGLAVSPTEHAVGVAFAASLGVFICNDLVWSDG